MILIAVTFHKPGRSAPKKFIVPDNVAYLDSCREMAEKEGAAIRRIDFLTETEFFGQSKAAAVVPCGRA